MRPEYYDYHHPDMSTPLEATIAFDSVWRYADGVDYEQIHPYIEAVYVGNVDIMPLLSFDLLNDIMRAYKGSKNEHY